MIEWPETIPAVPVEYQLGKRRSHFPIHGPFSPICICSSYSLPPLYSLGWCYQDKYTTTIDRFEEVREPMRVRNMKDLMLARQERAELLLDWGVSHAEIGDAILTAHRIRWQRQATIKEYRISNRPPKQTPLFGRPAMTPDNSTTCSMHSTSSAGSDALQTAMTTSTIIIKCQVFARTA
jgi:hypothetical protein